MKSNKFGQVYCTSDELCVLLYSNPEIQLNRFAVTDPENYNNAIKNFHVSFEKLNKYNPQSHENISIEDFDRLNQNNWFMPDEYKVLDIVQHIQSLCQNQKELQRVNSELDLYQERNLLDLLRFLKYLVDTLRKNKIVWGVGRGSSTASYVLYLLGVHKINSIKYDLDIEEFLK
jgi:DNA polymerase III alpha subunit